MEARIEELERELAQAREELQDALAAAPVNGDAYVRRLQEETLELRRDCESLEGEANQLRASLAEQRGSP